MMNDNLLQELELLKRPTNSSPNSGRDSTKFEDHSPFDKLVSSALDNNESDSSSPYHEDDSPRRVGEKRPFQCEYQGCYKTFTKLSRLKRHKIIHNENRERYYCNKDGCAKSYGTKYDLVAHQKKKHGNGTKRYRCNFTSCEISFEDKEELFQHKIQHMRSGKFNICHLVFSLSGTLSKKRAQIVKIIEDNRSSVSPSVTQRVTHLISTAADVAAESTQVKEAKKRGVFIVNENFLFQSIEKGHKLDEEDFSLINHFNFSKIRRLAPNDTNTQNGSPQESRSPSNHEESNFHHCSHHKSSLFALAASSSTIIE